MRKKGWLKIGYLGVMFITLAAVTVFSFYPQKVERVEAAGGYIIFDGHGRGHGVGMCMAGVYYRVLRGETWRTIIPYYYRGVGFGSVDDNRPIRVLCRDGVIRVYTLKEYLYRQMEEPDSWPVEGLKVLAIAMRTYAISVINRGKHAAQGFDICSSGSCCQAFDERINPATRPNTVAAVNSTAGIVITYQGSVIVAAYHGCCGGHTAGAEEVWGGTGYPYWTPVPDDACAPASGHDWRVTLSWSDLEARLNASGDTAVGSLYSLTILSLGRSGRVTKIRISGSGGYKDVSGSLFADRVGLPTNFFSIEEQHFEEYICLQNPSDTQQANCRVTFMMPAGEAPLSFDYTVAPHSRLTIYVNDFVMQREVSTKVESLNGVPIVAERAMYFNYQGRKRDGHAAAGAPQAETNWYLAEGYTGGDFDSYLVMQNPDAAQAAQVTVSYYGRQGLIEEQDYAISPQSRFTVGVDAVPGLSSTEFSACISSNRPIVAERVVYFGGNRPGGTSAPGVKGLKNDWYFAEGFTGAQFDTYVVMANPDPERTARVQAEFMLPGGASKNLEVEVPPQSRGTICVDAVPGLGSTDVSTHLHSDIPIVAERAMYFNYRGMAGGHDSAGISALSSEWYFAEGCTGSNFDTWLCFQNPGDNPAQVTVTFMLDNGSIKTRQLTVNPKSRFSLLVNSEPGMAAAAFSIKVDSSLPIAVERSMYFNYRGRDGGSNQAGIPAPSTTWYFAEGYTGQ